MGQLERPRPSGRGKAVWEDTSCSTCEVGYDIMVETKPVNPYLLRRPIFLLKRLQIFQIHYCNAALYDRVSNMPPPLLSQHPSPLFLSAGIDNVRPIQKDRVTSAIVQYLPPCHVAYWYTVKAIFFLSRTIRHRLRQEEPAPTKSETKQNASQASTELSPIRRGILYEYCRYKKVNG